MGVSVLVAIPFLILGGLPLVVGWVVFICLGVLVVTVGFSSNTMKKEIRSGTSIFLLSSPVDPTDIVLGKWGFYARLGSAVWAVGIAALASCFLFDLSLPGLLFVPVPTRVYVWLFVILGVTLCFIPFLSIYRMAENLHLYPVATPYFLLIGLLCCAPFGLMILSAMVGVGLVDAPSKALRYFPRAKIPLQVLGWICFICCILNIFLLLPITLGETPFGAAAYAALIGVDLSLLPLASGFYFWALFCGKSQGWWREKLLSEKPTLSSI